MKTKAGDTGFWQPGFALFSGALAKQEKQQLAPLLSELESTSDPARRQEIGERIAAVKAEFKAKRKAALYSLFAKG